MNNIAVSVIVSIYNHENCLSRCLDSLVYQTLENIEIILVDNCSTTDTLRELMESWQIRFPEKVQIIKSEKSDKASTKNTGLGIAQGKYITFVDSVDYLDYKMLNKLYSLAEKCEYPEMVYSPFYSVSENKLEKASTLLKHDNVEDYLKTNTFYLHGKLLRADLFQRFGPFPDFTMEEDSSWLFSTTSNLTEIVYHPIPLYYHETSHDSFYSDILNATNIKDIFKSLDRVRELTSIIHSKYAFIYSLNRIYSLSKSNPLYSDIFNRYIRDNLHNLDDIEDIKEISESLYKKITIIKEYYTEMPLNIFVNGFEKNDNNALAAWSEQAFRETANIVALNSTTCDLDSCPPVVKQAYIDGNTEFVGHYFALKACYEQGGIYIDKDIIIEHPLNILLNDPCFFGFETDDSFTDKIFGCCPKNACFEKILQTYDSPSLYENKFASLSSRIRTVLIGMYNIKMRSCFIPQYEKGFCLYPVEMFVYATPHSKDMHLCHYKSLESSNPDEIRLPSPIHTALWNRYTRNEVKKENADNLRKDREFLKNKVTRLETRTDKLLQDRTWLQDINTRQKIKIEKLDADCNWLQNQKSILEKNRDWLQNKVSLLETKKAGLEKDRDWLQNKVSLLETKKAGLEKDRDWLQNKVSLLETKKADLEKDRDWLQNKNAILENRIVHLDASLNEFQTSRLARIGLKITKLFRKKH